MTQSKFAAIALAMLALPITKITEQLDELTPDQLTELRALENAADGKQRSTLNELIDGKLAELAAKNTDPAEDGHAASTAAPDAAAPAWQADDYVGPLTGEQGQWRAARQREFEARAITK